jgi:hypothetical protein
MVYVDLSFSLMKSLNDINSRHKHELFSNLSIKNYFVNRQCIKYVHVQQLFRFDEQPGQIDISGKLRIVVSIDALNSLTHRYKGKTYRTFPLYFLIVS